MDNFNAKMSELGVPDILDKIEYEYPGFNFDEKLFSALDEILSNNLKVLVHGDCDPDGAFGAKIILETFDRLGHTNIEFYKYKTRDHVLSDEEVSYAIYEKFDYFIIIDSSSGDLNNIRKLCSFNVKTIIIDHHQTFKHLKEYPEDCIIINSELENKLRGHKEFCLSAGALTFCLMSEFLNRKVCRYLDLSAYALITLYSDCMDMSNKVNRSIYFMAMTLEVPQLPIYVRHFLRNYDVFRRRFIEFTFVPKINSLFRSERLDLVNEYLFESNDLSSYNLLIDQITKIHENNRELVNIATDVVTRENMDNIVVANLSNTSIPINLNKLYNYTGLVANNLSNDYGKPCVVLCDNGSGIKGSFRDCLSRNYLKIFKQFCRAEGHNSAFAINLKYHEFSEFMEYVEEKVNKKFFILGVDEPVELEYSKELPDREFLNAVALYNEFSGIGIPIATIKKKNTFSYSKSYSKNYSYKYKWGEYYIDSSSYFPPNYEFNIKPILTQKVKLIVYNRSIIL